jgi:hypothetical protein
MWHTPDADTVTAMIRRSLLALTTVGLTMLGGAGGAWAQEASALPIPTSFGDEPGALRLPEAGGHARR